MKTNICLTVDVDLVMSAREKKLKLSQLVSDYLRSYLSFPVENTGKTISEIDTQLVSARARVLELERQQAVFQKEIRSSKRVVLEGDVFCTN